MTAKTMRIIMVTETCTFQMEVPSDATDVEIDEAVADTSPQDELIHGVERQWR